MNETVKPNRSEKVETNSTKEVRTPEKLHLRRCLGFLGRVGCVLGFFSFCFAGFVFWQLYNFSNQFNGSQALLNKQVADQTVLLNKHAQSIDTLRSHLSDNTVRTAAVAKGLKQVQGSSEESWLLAEAEYLLRAANLQLQTNHDISGAMKLLKQANEVLNSINGYALFPIRKGVEEDIAALNSVPVIDVTGIWLQLNAAISQVQALPLLTPNGFDAGKVLYDSEKSPVKASERPSNWVQHLERVLLDSWHFFSRQFYFRKHTDVSSSALVSSQEEVRLRQSLQMMLTQAQQALLMQNETIYKQSLEDALRWIRVYFHNSSSEAKALLAKLDYLQQKNIAPSAPVITRGLSALESYTAQSSGAPDARSEKVTGDAEKNTSNKPSHMKVTPSDSEVPLSNNAASKPPATGSNLNESGASSGGDQQEGTH